MLRYIVEYQTLGIGILLVYSSKAKYFTSLVNALTKTCNAKLPIIFNGCLCHFAETRSLNIGVRIAIIKRLMKQTRRSSLEAAYFEGE